MAARAGFLQLRSSKEIRKPRVKILPATSGLGMSYCVWAEDTLKLTKQPFCWQPFAYVWAVTPHQMLRELERYMELKGIRN